MFVSPHAQVVQSRLSSGVCVRLCIAFIVSSTTQVVCYIELS